VAASLVTNEHAKYFNIPEEVPFEVTKYQ